MIKAFFQISFLLLILTSCNQQKSDNPTTTTNENPQKSQKNTIGQLLKIPEKLYFASEEVPMEKFDIRESFENELYRNVYYQSNIMLMLKRSTRYFPVIERILAENNIPNDFKYIPIIESSLSNAVSPRGASGFWQIMKNTGVAMGLEINKHVDERYHLEKATQVACDYLNNAYEHYKSWTLAAASYNYGMGNINRCLKEQKVNSYYDLHLNMETRRYVFRALAIKTIFENPSNYQIEFTPGFGYEPIETKNITVKETIPVLVDFAIMHNTSFKILKILNPWLRSSQLPVRKGEEYIIKVPHNRNL